MNVQRIAAIALIVALIPAIALAGRGGGGFRGGGGGFSRGGFDMHNDAPQSFSHSSTGPAGTQRSTSALVGPNGASHTTTSTNGSYSRTGSGAMSSNGNYTHSTNTNTAYGGKSSSTTGNTQTGNYSHQGSGSNGYGAYNTSGSGNAHTGSYNGSTNAANVYGQTYHSSTYTQNGVVYHGATVTNPVYGGYSAWGWNGGYAWYPAPYYYGGGFWGPFAVGAASAMVFGTIAWNNQTYTSYQAQPESAGAKLLASYKLTQTQCGKPNLVVIFGPNNSVICAEPNSLVSAGNYSVNEQTLTIVSAKS